MRLAETQRLLIDGIHPQRSDEARDAASRLLDESGVLSAADRLDIYRSNITAARVRALGAIYPVCTEIVGDECFGGMARTFAWQAPDRSEDLNIYGESFADFLAGQVSTHEAFSELPYLPDLARLEWHWHASFYAADDESFATPDLAELAPDAIERVTFPLSASLGLLETGFPVLEIWRRHREKCEVASVEALQDKEYLCIYREQYESRVERIDQQRHALLRVCGRGMSLADLAEHGAVKQNLSTLLPELIARGWIVKSNAPNTVGLAGQRG